MIGEILRLVRAELLKLRHRRLVWVLYGLLCVGCLEPVVRAWSALARTASGASAASAPYRDVLGTNGATAAALLVLGRVGLFAVAVLTATTIGMEFGVGTVRPVLAGGIRRSSFLVAQVLALTFVAGVGILLLVFGNGVVAALARVSLGLPSPDHPGAPEPDLMAAIGRVLGGMMPFMALAGMVAVLARSSSIATAVPLVYYLLELIGAPSLVGPNAPLSGAGKYLLVCNVQVVTLPPAVAAGTRACLTADGSRHAAVVLAAYTFVFGALALWSLSRQDITAPRGD